MSVAQFYFFPPTALLRIIYDQRLVFWIYISGTVLAGAPSRNHNAKNLLPQFTADCLILRHLEITIIL